MPRSVPEWIGPTPDTKAPPRVRARVFMAYEGKCYITGKRITPADHWELEHKVALINGGENREGNLAPVLAGKPHRDKTALDVAIKSKTARMRAKHLGLMKPKFKWPKRRFGA